MKEGLRSLLARIPRPGWRIPLGSTSLVLLWLAGVSMWRGFNYGSAGIPRGTVPPAELVSGMVPLTAWPAVWAAAGCALLIGLFWRRMFALGASLCGTLWILWGIAFVVAALVAAPVATTSAVTGGGFIFVGLAAWSLASRETDDDDEAGD